MLAGEGLEWMAGPPRALKVTGRSGISQARTRLGWRPLQQLYDELVGPIAGGALRRDLRVLHESASLGGPLG